MLVLSRIKNEEIVIIPKDKDGTELQPIVVTLVASSNGRAKIGVTAPRDYSVNRKEIQIAIDRSREQNHHVKKIAPLPEGFK